MGNCWFYFLLTELRNFYLKLEVLKVHSEQFSMQMDFWFIGMQFTVSFFEILMSYIDN